VARPPLVWLIFDVSQKKMADEAQQNTEAESPAGGCALGCGSLFVLVGIILPLLLVFTRSYEPEMLLFPLGVGGPAFLVGHILAFVALGSKSDAVRKSGKRALLVMWSGVALFGGVYLVLRILGK
jgi:hypothetical protein